MAYEFITPDEAAFIEAAVDHMIPADAFTPSGTELGIAACIDRALASGWGKGARLYMQGPWKQGTPSQGYQLPLTPSELYRAAIPAADAACRKAFGERFHRITPAQREAFLLDLQQGKVVLEGGPPARTFFNMLYENVMEGLFADPIHGGNRGKAGWKLVGFPGINATTAPGTDCFQARTVPPDPPGIADIR